MSAGMDALTISKLLPPGKLRTHTELVKATGFDGARMRKAIALAIRENRIVSDTILTHYGRKGGSPKIQCWKGIANA